MGWPIVIALTRSLLPSSAIVTPHELLASWGQASLDMEQGKSIPPAQYSSYPPLLFQEANPHLQFSYGYGYFSCQNKYLLHPFIAQHLANHLQTLDALDSQAQGELIYRIFAHELDDGVLELLVEYLQSWAKSRRHQSFFKDLYVHLKSFYRSYCHNYWLFNAPITAPPAMRLRQEKAVGINVFILITLISKLISSPFHPCGLLGDDFDRDRFKIF
ncbi:MAG: hypothetical protein HC796_07615 [Synechococcaceae cyanobacterium RL_1_2]|nr:hypothetical protein [Synechococcaceae cyanobacterium RL_1_2]